MWPFARANDGRISSAISSYPHFASQFRAIANLILFPNTTSTRLSLAAAPSYILDWARAKLRRCLDACASLSLGREDGPAMVDVAWYFKDPSVFFSQMFVTPASLLLISRYRYNNAN